jgi:hypothetical protein
MHEMNTPRSRHRQPERPNRVSGTLRSHLAVADLAERAERARVLPLHPRRMLAVLDDPGVVDDPGRGADLGRDPLRTARTRSAGSQGKSARNCCSDSYRRRLTQPKQGRLQTLAGTLLDQTHVQKRVLPLTHAPSRQRTRATAHAARSPPSPASPLPSVSSSNDDRFRGHHSGPDNAPFNELTESY